MQELELAHELSKELALKAGKMLRENLGQKREIEFKGVVDIVTEMDKRAEAMIIAGIQESFPKHGILTEESDELVSDSPVRWIIDPIDGTTNYAHGYPVYCVSIGIEEAGVLKAGVVYDPNLDETFTAVAGKGAFLNGKPIRVSDTLELDKSLLATGFPYDIRTSSENNLDCFSRFAVRAQAIRRAGSAALDICNVACGRFDGFWELKLKPWDLAAAVLIAKEAGGRVTGMDGTEFGIFDGDVLVSNGHVHDEMLKVVGT
jgi:myo-inositol-1(or 4)-monophosphatase